MANVFSQLSRLVARDGAAALVTVVQARGSTPREAGARMVVANDGASSGTIGGGRLEHDAIAEALRQMARGQDTAELLSLALGPALGQCCGGHVRVLVECFTGEGGQRLSELAAWEARGTFQTAAIFRPGQPVDRQPQGQAAIPPFAELAGDRLGESFGDLRCPVAIFGAGHVGKALAYALAPLPFNITLVDSRADLLGGLPFANLSELHAPQPAAVVASLSPASLVLIMTHDHGQDLDILHAALCAGPFSFIGMIGSQTKRARFESRLAQLGQTLEDTGKFVCPIGISGISSKEPAVIAASVAAQLLIVAGNIAKDRFVPQD